MKKARLFTMLSRSRSRTFVLCLAHVVFWSPAFDKRAAGDEPPAVSRVFVFHVDAPNGRAAELEIQVFGVRVDLVTFLDNSDEANRGKVDHPAEYRISDSSLDRILFGQHSDATDLRLRLGRLASSKIEEAGRCCELTAMQRQKLQLAANGDVKRFIDMFEDVKQEFRTQVVDAKDDDIFTLATELSQKAAPLRRRLCSGPFDKSSLFAKTLRNIRLAEPTDDCLD